GLIGSDRAALGPGADPGDFLGAGGAERAGGAELLGHVARLELGALVVGGIEGGDDGLFQLRAAEAIGACDQGVEIEAPRVAPAPRQVEREDLAPYRGARQIDEEDLVEAALAQELGRELG